MKVIATQRPNIDLLRRTLARVEQNPGVWNHFAATAVTLAIPDEAGTPLAEVVDADNRARDLLGLTVFQVPRLFNALSTIGDVREVVGEICIGDES